MQKIENKNYAIILEVLNEAKTLTKTKLVKILFLIDLYYNKMRGKKLSTLDYTLYFYGPYPAEIEKILGYLKAFDYINFEERLSYEGKRYYLISISKEFKENKLLTDEEKAFIKNVVNRYSRKDLDEILKEVYAMDKVKNGKFGEVIM
ncbi:hypothetical protein Marpi_1162 [Marinitoga piezophila KA3]|uniref:Antitoxin SocA-like Panacea domain-containing protein n=1 Tax=Marinitoga piezophila (strain DSM 14283 / JCM 11233 / KA3) TaxID=443254 RepID=H2J888_MARPK|nr:MULTISPECIES: type II toxin-antitoxin system antitoxin SocA domain-containing protein [Marinitoga]AEX85572.1 hypothetical protein Marpi_1162 [Marinitoga piezophila KA3]APT76043.1 hypothetical protein LN42_06350 [Marinitoga sp. 1137]NUU97719.1 hypothetical protein [Marinitoga sp. 1138]